MEKIFVAVDNERIELTGEDKKAFLAQREIDFLLQFLLLFHLPVSAFQGAAALLQEAEEERARAAAASSS
jgi:hypothetical protein